MLVTLILGAAAGWGAGFAEDHVRRLMAEALSVDEAAFKPIEIRSIALVAALFLAALLSWLIATPNAVALTLGALIGVLGPRLSELIRAARTPDYDA